MTTKMAMTRRVTAQQDMTTMTIATGGKVDDDGDGATDDGATGDDDDDDCDGQRRGYI